MVDCKTRLDASPAAGCKTTLAGYRNDIDFQVSGAFYGSHSEWLVLSYAFDGLHWPDRNDSAAEGLVVLRAQ